MIHGVRARLSLAIVALVAATAIVLGVGAYAFLDFTLHERVKDDAASQARFDLSVLIPSALSEPTREAFDASSLRELVGRRGVDLVADFGDIEPDFTELLSPNFVAALGRDEIAYQWMELGGQPRLLVGGALPGTDATFFFVHDATALESALGLLRLGLGGGAMILVVVAVVAARWIARGVLAPVDAASRAAERIEGGDLSARVPVTSSDEFGAWAERFNEMAESLETTITRLREAEAQNRRFVADVSHELRTPLGALVAEASILREDLASLPDSSRRAAELLVADVARLRVLVEDLMEISRFDARAEQLETQPVELGGLLRTIVAARLPDAALAAPDEPVLVELDPRRLERIVGNLLDNAREHAPGAAVDVRVAREAAAAVVVVADRGPGVPADRLGHLFERFYKADPSRHGGSSGLGLAIAAEHAALLGASLAATNREGGGLRVELRLPVTGSLLRGDDAAIRDADREAPITPSLEPRP